MYDYISLFSDDKYTGKIKTAIIERFLLDKLGLIKECSLTFSKKLNDGIIRVQGILANSNGSYAFDTLDGVEEINLIEIDIPDPLDPETEEYIMEIANSIAREFSWCIFDHETSSKLN